MGGEDDRRRIDEAARAWEARQAAADRESDERRREVEEIEARNAERASGAPNLAAAATALTGVRRRKRVELRASLVLRAGSERLVLPVLNVSLSGLFVAREGHDLSSLPVGTRVAFMLFDPVDVRRAVDAEARVVRHARDGMALEWSADLETTYRLAVLIDKLPKR